MRKINDPNYKVIPGEVTDYELALMILNEYNEKRIKQLEKELKKEKAK